MPRTGGPREMDLWSLSATGEQAASSGAPEGTGSGYRSRSGRVKANACRGPPPAHAPGPATPHHPGDNGAVNDRDDLGGPELVALRREAGALESVRANRGWWDAQAPDYYAEHGAFLGDDDLVWGPEGWSEELLGLLGPLAGRDVLEIGGGAAQGARWARSQGARVVSSDLSAGMLHRAAAIDAARGWPPIPLVQCDARHLPFADASFDVVFTAYGVLNFVADTEQVLRQVCRVLRPGGRFVGSLTHPFRWAFPDDPGPEGLTVRFSYFDRTPYVEQAADGAAAYVEHHGTIGDRVRAVVGAGLTLVNLLEPDWPDGHEQDWGGWSPLRGRLIPGTMILVAERPTAQLQT